MIRYASSRHPTTRRRPACYSRRTCWATSVHRQCVLSRPKRWRAFWARRRSGGATKSEVNRTWRNTGRAETRARSAIGDNTKRSGGTEIYAGVVWQGRAASEFGSVLTTSACNVEADCFALVNEQIVSSLGGHWDDRLLRDCAAGQARHPERPIFQLLRAHGFLRNGRCDLNHDNHPSRRH